MSNTLPALCDSARRGASIQGGQGQALHKPILPPKNCPCSRRLGETILHWAKVNSGKNSSQSGSFHQIGFSFLSHQTNHFLGFFACAVGFF